MSIIKKFEEFDFSQTLPVASKNALTNYFSCDECNALWRDFNKMWDKCKVCNSEDIELISEDEWYELVKSRLDEDEYEEMEKERRKGNEMFFDILRLKNDDWLDD